MESQVVLMSKRTFIQQYVLNRALHKDNLDPIALAASSSMVYERIEKLCFPPN